MRRVRCAAIRQAIMEELELDVAPTIVVSATMKDVQGTAAKLGIRCTGTSTRARRPY